MYDISKLNRMYQEAESADSDLYAEQRSNLLLVSGNHYTKKDSRFWKTLRTNENVSKEQKLRLTKNHTHKISQAWKNSMLQHCPNEIILPENENELKDQKAAELNRSVWRHLSKQIKAPQKKRLLAYDYIDIGECILKIFFDPNVGTKLTDQLELLEDGSIITTPRFTGKVIWERILGFNFFRDPEGKSFDECRWTGYRKMASTQGLLDQFKDDQEKLKFIHESSKRVYSVFDGQSGKYSDSNGLTLVREFYLRPCSEFENGYYFIATEDGILYEGPLPLGIYPIKYCGYDEIATSARSFSIIKQIRPYQAEVNRTASKIAECQITSDDKVLLVNGSTMTPGGVAHGIKAVKVNGQAPVVMPGRTGNQYIDYMNSQISEMYNIANVVENDLEKNSQQDPFSWLYRGLKEKKKFVLYAQKFGEFWIDSVETSLELAKAYLSEEEIIPMVGKSEQVNIPEFKSTDRLQTQIKIEPIAEDVESIMGKTLSLQNVLQYCGSNLNRSDIGRIVNALPFINDKQLFTDLTIDYENATNDILAMDRGTYVPANQNDNHQYYLQRLTHRMKQSDFRYLPDQIKQMYQQKLSEHEQAFAQQQQALEAAQSGYVPSGGALLGVDMYIPNPQNPALTKRARLPAEALTWLIKKLEQQGTSQQMLQSVDPSVVQQMTQTGLLGQQGMQQQAYPQDQGFN